MEKTYQVFFIIGLAIISIWQWSARSNLEGKLHLCDMQLQQANAQIIDLSQRSETAYNAARSGSYQTTMNAALNLAYYDGGVGDACAE